MSYRRALRRFRRSSAAGFGAVMGLVIAGILAYLVLSPGEPSEAERKAVQTYRDAIHSFAVDGGRVVVTGIRPSLGDLSFGRISGAQFRGMAQGWKAEMRRVREGFGSVKAPTPELRRAAGLFDRAMQGYLDAIDAFVAASFKTGEELKAAISAAVPTAESADKTYDRAGEIVKAEFRRVGLPEPPTI